MSLFTSLQNFLVYLRLHKGRSRKTQEQYVFHIWRFICWTIPELTRSPPPEKGESEGVTQKGIPHNVTHPDLPFSGKEGNQKPLSSLDFLPPLDKESMKNWRSPLLDLAKSYREPTIEQISKEDFDAWRLSLADSGLSVKTVNAHIITIRSWLKYLKKEQIDCLDPTTLDLMKVADREVTFLTSEEIERFFSAIPRETIQGKRDYAIAECIYSTGLRISELTALNRSDVNFETLEFAVRGKGGKLRVVYLTQQAKEAIKGYLNVRIDDFSPLFIRHNWSDIPLHAGRGGMSIGSNIPLQAGRGGTSKASDGVVLPWNGDEYIIRKGVSYKDIPYNPALRIRASELRKSGNLPEVVFWNTVKNKAWHNLDFDRQKIIGNYIVDFYDKYLGLVVEIDGNSHDEKVEYDSERDTYLRGIGLRVIHFPVMEIMKNIEGCMDTLMRFIIESCEVERLPRPSGTPSDGRGIGTPRSLDRLGTGSASTPSDGRGIELSNRPIIENRAHTSTIPHTEREYRLTRFFITNMVKEYGLKAGILKNIHAHTLRHSFATTLLTNGADIRIIQELLGHASITTTQVYTHVTNPKLKEAHKKFHR